MGQTVRPNVFTGVEGCILGKSGVDVLGIWLDGRKTGREYMQEIEFLKNLLSDAERGLRYIGSYEQEVERRLWP